MFPPSLVSPHTAFNRPQAAKSTSVHFQGIQKINAFRAQPPDIFKRGLTPLPEGDETGSSDEQSSDSIDLSPNHPEARFFEALTSLEQADSDLADLNPDLKNEFGDTLLMHAIFENKPHVVKRLIQAGADVNVKNKNNDGASALLTAIIYDSAECLDLLLQAPGVDISLSDIRGNSALAFAARMGRDQAIEKLLRHGADINQRNEKGLTPLALACIANSPKTVERLLNATPRPNIDLPDYDEDTPLLLAITTGNPSIVHQLLEAGANPNLANKHHFSPLAAAVIEQNRELCQALLEKGAHLNQADALGETLLTRLSQMRGASPPIDFLLSLGADVNQPSSQGVSPFRHAILTHNSKVVERLLAHPNLTELPKLRQALQPLIGDRPLSPTDLRIVAGTLTSPMVADALRENPSIGMNKLFQGLRKTLQGLRASPEIQAFKASQPDAYQRTCLDFLNQMGEEENGDKRPFLTRFKHFIRQAGAGQNQVAQFPDRIMTAHPWLSPNVLMPSTLIIRRNLMDQLHALGAERPYYWHHMRLPILHQLFESHEEIERLRLHEPRRYLLACKAFLGLTEGLFTEADEYPAFFETFPPNYFHPFYLNEITETLQRGYFRNNFDDRRLTGLLTRRT